MRQSVTTVIERNVWWEGRFTVEPVEAAWAAEAIYFIRVLEAEGEADGLSARVRISPDGIHWCAEGSRVPIPNAPGLSFGRVTHFGGWLALEGELPPQTRLKVLVYVVLKS